ncbi:hypothetical protein [Agromyces aureus]|uniref:hypothetical protein n=1 Tax=Agromyces aureus TaxID=453304 RepID=UPI000A6AFCF7|nr:hypothetical protein [Agromyces aureus]
MTYALQVETSAPRPGKRFEPIHERQLHEIAVRASESLPGAARGLVVVPEFAGPIGVPDFTAFVGKTTSLLARQRSSVPPVINELDAGVLTVAHVGRALHVEELAQALAWPEATIAGRAKRLVATGALIDQGGGRYVRPSVIAPRGRLYAIEAKIEDWRSALRQVRTYRVWADAYVLVMTGVSERSAQNLLAEVLRDKGGLILDGQWIARPRLGEVKARRRLQAAELFAAATLTGLDDPAFTLGIHS